MQAVIEQLQAFARRYTDKPKAAINLAVVGVDGVNYPCGITLILDVPQPPSDINTTQLVAFAQAMIAGETRYTLADLNMLEKAGYNLNAQAFIPLCEQIIAKFGGQVDGMAKD